MGDKPGHPFRGNQYTSIGGGSFGGNLAGVRVPGLGRGEVHLVRYSEEPEHVTGVGEYAHAGKKLDDLVEASSYYAKGGNLVVDATGKVTREPHRGFLTIGRARAAAARESEAGWSNGDTYREVRGVLNKENIDAVVDVASGSVVYRRGGLTDEDYQQRAARTKGNDMEPPSKFESDLEGKRRRARNEARAMRDETTKAWLRNPPKTGSRRAR